MRAQAFKALLFFTAWLTLCSPAAFAGPRVVNCDDGDLLQDAIDSGAGSAKAIEISVFGTCYEEIRLLRDGVSIVGDGFTVIHGQIQMFNSSEVTFQDLTVTGPGFGFQITNSRVRLIRVQVIDNESSGIFAQDGSVVRTRNVSISGNQEGIRLNRSHAGLRQSNVDSNLGDGILALQNSSVHLQGGSVSGNSDLGLRVNWSSSIQVYDTEITSNSNYGVLMQFGSSGLMANVTNSSNGGYGIELSGNASLEVSGGMINANGSEGAWITEHSFLHLYDVQIIDNAGHGVAIARDSGVVVAGNTQILDNAPYYQMACQDDESSVDVESGAVIGPVENCTGF